MLVLIVRCISTRLRMHLATTTRICASALGQRHVASIMTLLRPVARVSIVRATATHNVETEHLGCDADNNKRSVSQLKLAAGCCSGPSRRGRSLAKVATILNSNFSAQYTKINQLVIRKHKCGRFPPLQRQFASSIIKNLQFEKSRKIAFVVGHISV